ncbi:MAG: hypothetical protein WC501_01620 [Candidatus Micrarchaeia archaeon]
MGFKIENYFPVILFIVLILVIVYSFFCFPKESISNQKEIIITTECSMGEKKECLTDNGCAGYLYCSARNEWGPCTVSKICEPDSKKRCWMGCVKGYYLCNECGTKYSGCIPE